MGIFSTVIGGLLGTAQVGYDIYNSNRNYQLQLDNLNYQKDLQQQVFAREDNAVQRRAADLSAAGLSKTLAAGSSAGAGSVISTSAPQHQSVSIVDRISTGLALSSQAEQLKQAELSNKLAEHNLKWYQETGLPSTVDGNYLLLAKLLGELLPGDGSTVSKLSGYVDPASQAIEDVVSGKVLSPGYATREVSSLEDFLGRTLTKKEQLELYKWKRGFGPKPSWYDSVVNIHTLSNHTPK